jgi:hypothetical protein
LFSSFGTNRDRSPRIRAPSRGGNPLNRILFVAGFPDFDELIDKLERKADAATQCGQVLAVPRSREGHITMRKPPRGRAKATSP